MSAVGALRSYAGVESASRLPAWWPNWSGQAAAIVASGPSARNAGVDRLRGRVKVIAIKQSYDLCPWADAVYGCDTAWWKYRRGLPEFGGLKLTWSDEAASTYRNVHKVLIPDKNRDEILVDVPGTIGAGGNSGFQALNLAVQFGATKVLLVGYDMNVQGGVHWYGRNNWAMAHNPDAAVFRRWIAALTASKKALDDLGVSVVNACQTSGVRCFTKWSIEDTLRTWQL